MTTHKINCRRIFGHESLVCRDEVLYKGTAAENVIDDIVGTVHSTHCTVPLMNRDIILIAVDWINTLFVIVHPISVMFAFLEYFFRRKLYWIEC